ncbi:MAG: endonuclease/exonuclease/phosphatase family protein [Bacteriovorax sp.]
MKLCLFNVENFFLLNGAQGDAFKKPVDKIEWIAKTIKEINADVTMLCEVGGLESLDLFNTKYLNSDYFSALLKGNSNRGIEMGYLIKKDFPYDFAHFSHAHASIEFNYSFEIEENKKLLLDELKIPPHKFSRDISELRILKDNEVKMILLLVHLKSKWDRDGVDWNGKERRKAELKALVKTYNRLRAEFNYKVPIVVAGDMNGTAQKGQQEPEFDDLYNLTDLEDVLEVMGEPHEHRHSFFYFGKENNRESFQLDYILLPKELHALVKKEDSGIYLFRDAHGVALPYPQESYQRYALPSDHYPVVASLDFL